MIPSIEKLKPSCLEHKRHLLIVFFMVILLALNADVAYANVGLPMIFVTWPSMFVALIPVALIEGLVFFTDLKITYKESMRVSFRANLISTVIGIPVSWIILLAIELLGALGMLGVAGIFKFTPQWPPFLGVLSVPLMAAWVGPISNEYVWMVPIAMACGLILAYFLSVGIEFDVAEKMLKTTETAKLYQAVRKANLLSYSILLALCFLAFIFLRF